LPLYAYRCTQCGHRFEKIQHFSSKPELVCPNCQGLLERPLTAPAFKFKGSGWYVNDYAGKNEASASNDSISAPAPAAAPTAAAPAAAPAPAVAKS
jgi:putative FmdB family regulatory protein